MGIDFSDFKDTFTKILQDFGLSHVELLFVEDRNKWLQVRGFTLREDEHERTFATTIHWTKTDLW